MVKGTPEHGLSYVYQNQEINSFTAYTDSDWGACSATRKSRSGFVLFYAGAPISWRSKKQTCIALASNEAELVAASDACRDLAWVGFITTPIISSRSIDVYCDNQGAIDIISSPSAESTKRSKHVDIRYFYARTFFSEYANARLLKVHTDDNIADAFTKALSDEPFRRHRDNLVRVVEGGC